MGRFERVQQILDTSVGGPGAPVGAHGAFWRGTTRDQFIGLNIFGLPLLQVGNGLASNLVKALKGEAPFGSDLGTAGGTFRRMPAGRPPVPDADIALISAWITDGAPDDGAVVADLREIRILPPLAIGRFGSSRHIPADAYPDPMDNYDAIVAEDVSQARRLVPAETLVVDTATGQILRAETPEEVRFKGRDGKIRPVAPFLEVWTRVGADGDWQPLTQALLAERGLSPRDVQWSVRVANLKAFRRTGQPGDRIEARLTGIADHGLKPLKGRGANLLADQSIDFGWVQYLQPTDAFPEIRLRFTPGAGKVYGHRRDFPELVVVYDANRGRWDDFDDNAPPTTSPTPRARVSTLPPGIYARQQTPGPGQSRNLGYLDDSCDGIVEVTLTVSGRPLSAKARISVGPPDFAPDSFHVRTVADDLQQMMFGPHTDDFTSEAELALQVIDIVRRALETVRLMDTDQQNRNGFGRGTFPLGPVNRAAYFRVRNTHAGLLSDLQGLLTPVGSTARERAVRSLQRILTFLRPYEGSVNFSATGVQRMPALMRGSDGFFLALTRRQRNLVAKAIEVFGTTPQTPEEAMVNLIQALGPGVTGLHTQFSLNGGPPLSDRLGTDAQEVLTYLRQGTAQGVVAQQMGLSGQPLIAESTNPDDSPFVQLISNTGHPMHGPLSAYTDPGTGENGIQVVRRWIASLGAVV